MRVGRGVAVGVRVRAEVRIRVGVGVGVGFARRLLAAAAQPLELHRRPEHALLLGDQARLERRLRLAQLGEGGGERLDGRAVLVRVRGRGRVRLRVRVRVRVRVRLRLRLGVRVRLRLRLRLRNGARCPAATSPRAYISPISPLYLPYISPISPLACGDEPARCAWRTAVASLHAAW